MNYCEKLKHYLDDCDENIDLIKEAIASLEGHFDLTQENELLHFSRVDAVAYLALKSIVRCKECKYHDKEKDVNYCDCGNRPDDWYCAGGKREE